MNRKVPSQQHIFWLSADDPELSHTVLQARFVVADMDALKAILGPEAYGDPELQCNYLLEDDELIRIVKAFDVAFDPSQLGKDGIEVWLVQVDPLWVPPPYLVHTGWELPLMLNGDKKLAKFAEPYPPMTFDHEGRFDQWVERGVLHKEVVLEPFPYTTRKWVGVRKVYYTLKGEEWRIPAMQLLWRAGGWNETLERLEGMLFGYQDWQMDWWIREGRKRGGFGGVHLCCAVSASGLDWLRSAGFRALPPCDKPVLEIVSYDPGNAAGLRAFMLEQMDSVALICFVLHWRLDKYPASATNPPRWQLPSSHIPELNGRLENRIAIALMRDELP